MATATNVRTGRVRRGGLCRLAGWMAAVGAMALPSATDAAPPAAAVSMAVSPAGQITVKLGDRVVADGTFALQVFGPAQLAADELPLTDCKVTVPAGATPTHATIVYAYAAFEARYDLTLAGEDLTISAHLTNADAKRSLRKVNFLGPTFHFARNPTGTINSWHWTYMVHEGLKAYHPGLSCPVGCVFAADDAFAFSVYSSTEFSRQELFNASFLADNLIPAECHLEVHTDRTVGPGTSADVDAIFRVTTDRAIPHLLGKYKQAYDAHFPVMLYTPDARPVGQFVGADGAHVRPGNPFGFEGDDRRFDSGLGTAEYVHRVAPAFEAKDAMGVLFWSPGGSHPPMYPPDFDDFPKSVAANLPALVRGFKQHHLRVGLCARCGDGVRRPAGKPFEVYRLSAENADDMRELLGRFKHMTDLGFDAFYLDTFGATDLNDVRILEQVRAAVGPDVLLYTEFSTDMTMPLAGRYCEWTDHGMLWDDQAHIDCLRFLCPDSTWLCKSRTDRAVPQYVVDHGMTPLVDDRAAAALPTPKR